MSLAASTRRVWAWTFHIFHDRFSSITAHLFAATTAAFTSPQHRYAHHFTM